MGKYKNFFVRDEATDLYIPSKKHDKYLKHLKIVIKSMGDFNPYTKLKKEPINEYSYWH
jgi:hypothetical protein